MNSLLYYFLQVFAASGLLYGYYHFFLRNNKFHFYNRYYLLLSAVISIIIPFLNIPVYFSQQQTESFAVLYRLTLLYDSNPVVLSEKAGPATDFFTLTQILYSCYLLLCAGFLARIILSINRIRRMRRQHPSQNLDKIILINTAEPGTPFSFFRWLFWNRDIELNTDRGQQIFRHELFHIRQKHSRDTLFMEMLTAVFWINPFFHLVKKELKTIHEFLADQAAIIENEEWSYAELLLMQALQTRQSLVNPFFQTQIKRRIAMITSSKQPQYKYLRKLMVLPLFILLLLLFAFSYKKAINYKPAAAEKEISIQSAALPVVNGFYQNEKTVKPVMADTLTPLVKSKLKKDEILELPVTYSITTGPLVVIDGVVQPVRATPLFFNSPQLSEIEPSDIESIIVLKDKSATLKYGQKGEHGVIEIIRKKMSVPEIKEIKATDTIPAPRNNIVFEIAETPPSFRGGEAEWRKYLMASLKPSTPIDNGASPGTYKVTVQFIVNTDGTVSDIKPLTNHGYGMESEVIRIIEKGPRWNPAIQNGKTVRAYKQQPVTFVVASEFESEPSVTESSIRKAVLNVDLDKMSAVYPNPAKHTVTIPYEAASAGNRDIRVFDLSGKAHITQKVNVAVGLNNLVVNVAGLPNGIYIISVTDKIPTGNNLYKIVKQ